MRKELILAENQMLATQLKFLDEINYGQKQHFRNSGVSELMGSSRQRLKKKSVVI